VKILPYASCDVGVIVFPRGVILSLIAGETSAGVPEEEPHDDEGLEEQLRASTFDLQDLISERHFLAKSGCVLAIFLLRVLTTIPIREHYNTEYFNIGLLFYTKYLQCIFS
jgi:hypothetical protein